ncbi:MAG: hypothetical protein KF708_24155 [Pirellulales bacterium]|nr:hypothetical protein [Pirellulales bacterium]
MPIRKHTHRFAPWGEVVSRPWRVASEWVSHRLGYAPYYLYFADIAPGAVRCELREGQQVPRRQPDYRLQLPPPAQADECVAKIIQAVDVKTELAIWGDFELLCRVRASGETECWRIPVATSHDTSTKQLTA